MRDHICERTGSRPLRGIGHDVLPHLAFHHCGSGMCGSGMTRRGLRASQMESMFYAERPFKLLRPYLCPHGRSNDASVIKQCGKNLL